MIPRAVLRRNPVVHKTTVFLRELGLFTKPRDSEGVQYFGHRRSVGGDWEAHGRFQFEYLKARGLAPSDVFLDIGCGSLRGGVHFIPYLDRGNYLGVEMSPDLLRAGIDHELPAETREAKAPELVVSDSFEFERLSRQPTYAFAGSVFSHLTEDDIRLCLSNLRRQAADGCKFYATYFETARPRRNYRESHPHYSYYYTQGEMRHMASDNGWECAFLGPWQHPGRATQEVVEFVAT